MSSGREDTQIPQEGHPYALMLADDSGDGDGDGAQELLPNDDAVSSSSPSSSRRRWAAPTTAAAAAEGRQRTATHSEIAMRALTSVEYREHMPDMQLNALTWRSLKYSVRMRGSCRKKAQDKQILHGISGSVRPGESLAILGPSGSGKSTLLDILAFRKFIGTTTGSVLLNGVERNKLYKRVVGYVKQDDALVSSLTVEEVLRFAARLRLPGSLSEPQRRLRIDAVLDSLGLQKVRKTRIGGTLVRGVSGGERKRVSIAVELLVNPIILFLDEPTSGLDSRSAQVVVNTLLQLASSRERAIVFTIHQPRSNIFQRLDRILLLAEGRTLFLGPTSRALPHFAALGYPCEPNTNPADHLLDLVLRVEQSEIAEHVRSLNEAFERTELARAEMERLQNLEMNVVGELDVGEYARSGLAQLGVLLRRECLANYRNPTMFWSLIFQSIIFGVVAGTLYSNIKFEAASAELNAIFFVILIFNLQAFSSLPALITFREIYAHERESAFYTAGAYIGARTLGDFILLSVICAPVFGVIVYALMALAWSQFPFFLLTCVAFSFCAGSIIVFVAVVSPSLEVGLILSSLFIGLALITSGFLVPAYSMPSFYTWLYQSSYARFGLDALVINNFGECGGALEAVRPQVCLAAAQNQRSVLIPNECAALLVRVYGLDKVCADTLPDKWLSMGLLFVVGAGFRLLTYSLLRLRKRLLKMLA